MNPSSVTANSSPFMVREGLKMPARIGRVSLANLCGSRIRRRASAILYSLRCAAVRRLRDKVSALSPCKVEMAGSVSETEALPVCLQLNLRSAPILSRNSGTMFRLEASPLHHLRHNHKSGRILSRNFAVTHRRGAKLAPPILAEQTGGSAFLDLEARRLLPMAALVRPRAALGRRWT